MSFRNSSYNEVAYLDNGTIKGNNAIYGYFDNGTVRDGNMRTLGYIEGNVIKDT